MGHAPVPARRAVPPVAAVAFHGSGVTIQAVVRAVEVGSFQHPRDPLQPQPRNTHAKTARVFIIRYREYGGRYGHGGIVRVRYVVVGHGADTPVDDRDADGVLPRVRCLLAARHLQTHHAAAKDCHAQATERHDSGRVGVWAYARGCRPLRKKNDAHNEEGDHFRRNL